MTATDIKGYFNPEPNAAFIHTEVVAHIPFLT